MQLQAIPPSETGLPITHIVRDLRGDVLGEIDSPSAPAGLYPDLILQVAARLNDDYAPSPYQFYDLWELILAHWFPEREGYTIKPQWSVPYLGGRDDAAAVTFAVLDVDAPVLLLQISAPSDFHNVHTRATGEDLSARIFEHVAPYCPLDHLCVISAMGKKWTAFHRSANLTAREARSLGEDRVDWMEDVISEPSYEILERFLSVVKEAVRSYRLAEVRNIMGMS
ncbi:hypothetical protein B0H17DRAFT_1064381 [Mycena rosella]|uniref:Uncharacterized protein n=1 Tax=Mycena rosella TaxID=1033263 RepID=A0AAD7GJB5_MYCRO|nr:hypothetical protein B0H17DRAFT_1064381 [Mycena rosella]